jgi:hypothetical protein
VGTASLIGGREIIQRLSGALLNCQRRERVNRRQQYIYYRSRDCKYYCKLAYIWIVTTRASNASPAFGFVRGSADAALLGAELYITWKNAPFGVSRPILRL